MPQSPEHIHLSTVKQVNGSPHSSNPALLIEFFFKFYAFAITGPLPATVTFPFHQLNFRLTNQSAQQNTNKLI